MPGAVAVQNLASVEDDGFWSVPEHFLLESVHARLHEHVMIASRCDDAGQREVADIVVIFRALQIAVANLIDVETVGHENT